MSSRNINRSNQNRPMAHRTKCPPTRHPNSTSETNGSLSGRASARIAAARYARSEACRQREWASAPTTSTLGRTIVVAMVAAAAPTQPITGKESQPKSLAGLTTNDYEPRTFVAGHHGRPRGRESRMTRAVVVGGSLGGLMAAQVLRDLEWDVDVLERSAVPLQTALSKRSPERVR
jgi:hypothetical protein